MKKHSTLITLLLALLASLTGNVYQYTNEHGPAFVLLRKAGLEKSEASAAIAWLEGVRPE